MRSTAAGSPAFAFSISPASIASNRAICCFAKSPAEIGAPWRSALRIADLLASAALVGASALTAPLAARDLPRPGMAVSTRYERKGETKKPVGDAERAFRGRLLNEPLAAAVRSLHLQCAGLCGQRRKRAIFCFVLQRAQGKLSPEISVL